LYQNHLVLILGIETSCDETGVALYEGRLLADAVHSQVAMHEAYGGVVPELASRDHIRRLVPLTRQVFASSKKRVDELAGIGYTEGPGLAGALLVGASFARGLAQALGIPAIGIHHLEGHLLSPLLSERAPRFPFVALLVSGGHTQLMRVAGVGRYQLLGETQDDAAGEAFDKTAKLLGLGYPGGPALSELALRGAPRRYDLPRPMLSSGNLDFSFSGLKTAVLREVTGYRERGEPIPVDGIAAAFEDAVVDALATKTVAAARDHGVAAVALGGGVAANRSLRGTLADRLAAEGLPLLVPPPAWCTDNGAMIGAAAGFRFAAGDRADASLEAIPNLALPWLDAS
jgi:N6-L-threonylcarbamoyladenine synthase